MFRIDAPGTATVMPTPAVAGSTIGYFTEGNAGTGTPATDVSADWLNTVQEELVGVILAAGLTLDKSNPAQLLSAINTLISGGGSASVNFAASPYTALSSKRTIAVDTSGGNVTVNLPAAAGVAGQEWAVVKTTSDANTATVDGNGSETINGSLTQVIDQQWTMLTLKSIGTGWVLK